MRLVIAIIVYPELRRTQPLSHADAVIGGTLTGSGSTGQAVKKNAGVPKQK